MKSGQCVLVVDGQAETEQVLKAVLEARGLYVNRIRASFEEVGVKRDTHVADVVVIDADDTPIGPCDGEQWERLPRVILGTARLASRTASDSQFLQKPFQYGELISAIERLLAARRV